MRLFTLFAVLLLLAPVSAFGEENGNNGRGGPVHLTSEVSVGAPNFNASSAPNLYVASCNRGFTLQSESRGGGIGGRDSVCTFLSLSASAYALGLSADASRFFDRAVREAEARHRFTRFFSWLPLIGGLF